jgi:hypothetical protein
LENPTGEEKPGPAGQGVENAQGQEGNQDSQGAGSLNPYVETVENISDKKDIDDILPSDAQEGFFQVLNLSPPGRLEIIYLITCRGRNPPFKCAKIIRTKSQAPNSKQIPITEIQNSNLHPLLELGVFEFGFWNLFEIWLLLLGI